MPSVPQWLRKVTTSPQAFRERVLIDAGCGLRLLDEVADPWQQEDFAACDPGWLRCVGLRREPAIQRVYLERPRGHAKTSDIGVSAAWALCAARRQISGVVAAGDLDQARLVRDAVDRLVVENDWLRCLLAVHNYRIVNRITGSACDVVASDTATAYGLTPDFLVCDELTHWRKREMWEAMFSSSAKRAACMVLIIANAGTGEGVSWQWKVREEARQSADWYFRRLNGPQASWISQKLLDEQRRMIPGPAFRRLWLNEWTRGQGDALDPATVEACCRLTEVPKDGWLGWTHIMGLDLGVKHDHAALVVLACQPGAGVVRLASVQSWKPRAGGEVDLQAVEQAVALTAGRYEASAVFYDPHQCALMAQQLRSVGLRMMERQFIGKSLNEMASCLLQAFESRRIELYRDEELMRDLLRLTIVEKPYGFKLEAVSDEFGHADRAIALAIALPTALEISGLPLSGDDGLGTALPLGV